MYVPFLSQSWHICPQSISTTVVSLRKGWRTSRVINLVLLKYHNGGAARTNILQHKVRGIYSVVRAFSAPSYHDILQSYSLEARQEMHIFRDKKTAVLIKKKS